MHVDAPRRHRGMISRFVSCRRVRASASPVIVTTILAASVSLAPTAVADSADSLRAAVTAVRQGTCQPLRSEPVVEQAADIVNRSTDVWLDHKGRAVPVPDPLPVLKDLGYGGGRAVQVQGAGNTDAEAIEGLLVVGYDIVPDCSYTDFGVSVMQNQSTGHYLAVVVLASA
jgi:hypothetical protein